MVSQQGCGESLTCAAMPGVAILVSRLWVKVDGLPLLSFYFPGSFFPFLLCLKKNKNKNKTRTTTTNQNKPKTTCKISCANDILRKDAMQNVSRKVSACY